MKKYLKSLIICVIILSFMFGINAKASAQDCVSEVVIDRESGRILHALNQDVMRPMASTTKVVTCITVIENYSLDEVIKIKREWTGIEGSSKIGRAHV